MDNEIYNFFEERVKSGIIPPILYKYRDYSDVNHKKTLTNSELFLSSPARFNDPYDCRIPVAYHILDGNHKKQEEYFRKIVNLYRSDLNDHQKEEEILRFIIEGRFTSSKWLDWAEKEFFKELDKNFGIISLSAVWDNILMWSHYAKSHKGFCIGFDAPILFSNEVIFGGGGPVNYEINYPIMYPMEDHMQQLFDYTGS